MKIRALRADEIECRVANVSSRGCTLLLYKDARCDKRILDETFGIAGWRNNYQEIKGNLFCTVEIWDKEKQQWIAKQDCGTESYTEKEKGEASDAFKRACFNIGIGRELYTKIFIFIACETEKDNNGRYKLKNPYEKWYVSEIETNNDTEKITYLQIRDVKQNFVAFTFGNKENDIPTEKLKCIQCGKEIPSVRDNNGKVMSPAEFSKVTDAKCIDCYNKAKKGVSI